MSGHGNFINEQTEKFIELICNYDSKPIPPIEEGKAEHFEALREAREKTAEIIETLGNSVNCFGLEAKDIIDKVKDNPEGYANLIQLSYEWVQLWDNVGQDAFGYEHTDGRNEMSTKLCKEAAGAIKEHNNGTVTNTELFPSLDDCVFRMHKTLIQSSTNIFINVLKENDNAVRELLEEKYVCKDRDVHLPMI